MVGRGGDEAGAHDTPAGLCSFSPLGVSAHVQTAVLLVHISSPIHTRVPRVEGGWWWVFVGGGSEEGAAAPALLAALSPAALHR